MGFAGAERVRQMYDMASRIYPDGTPQTKHLAGNVPIRVDETAGTAAGKAYYCVTQATPEFHLQSSRIGPTPGTLESASCDAEHRGV
jgi:hypothetical protein